MTADDKYFDAWPVLSERDLERANALFIPYVFYETDRGGDRRCTCTSCHTSWIEERMKRTQTHDDRAFFAAQHNQPSRCPRCGRNVILKNVGRAKKRDNLWEQQKIVFLHAKRGKLYAQAYYAIKSYRWSLDPKVEYSCTAVYRFAEGAAEMHKWQYDYTHLGISPSGKVLNPEFIRRKYVGEPFGGLSYGQDGYYVIGTENLAKCHLKYIPFSQILGLRLGDDRWQWDLMKAIAATSLHPQIEMLHKMGLKEIVRAMIQERRTFSNIIDWSQSDPRKAFRLTSAELRAIAESGKDRVLLQLFYRCKKMRVTVEDLKKWLGWLGEYTLRDFITSCKKISVSPQTAMRYIEKTAQTGKIQHEAKQWIDYIDAATMLAYDLGEHNVLWPKNLKQAHDAACAARAIKLDEQAFEKYEARYRALQKKYEFTDGKYMIVIPHGQEEIVTEGNALKHCVGGYAARHMNGVLDILFMRRCSAPDTPTWTIEMRGKSLQQVQGEGNRYENKPKGKAKDFLDLWLLWVAQGSRRSKNGEPIIETAKEKSA